MSEQEQPAAVPGDRSAPAAQARPARGHYVWRVVSGRGTGWAVAAVLAGAVTGLSIIDASSSGPGGPVAIRQAIVPPAGKAFFGAPGPGGAARRVQVIAPGGAGIGIAGPGPVIGQKLVPAQIHPGAVKGQLTTPFGQVVTGTVASVGKPGFTVTTPGGQTVTVTEQSSTVYQQGGSPVKSSAVTKGAQVWVLGSESGSAMTASVVAVISG